MTGTVVLMAAAVAVLLYGANALRRRHAEARRAARVRAAFRPDRPRPLEAAPKAAPAEDAPPPAARCRYPGRNAGRRGIP